MGNSKEQILDEIIRHLAPEVRIEYAIQVMDEYAKQEAIEFAEWLRYKGWECSSMFDTEKWGNYTVEVPDLKSEPELYSLYLISKIKV